MTTGKDLISPIRAEDSALTPFQELIEDVVVSIRPLRRFVSLLPKADTAFGLTSLHSLQLRYSDVSRDPDVHILPPAVIGFFAHCAAAGLVITLLLVPIVVVDALDSMTAKTIAIIISCAIFVLCLPGLTRANVKETVIAGTT